jgi:broad specificity phosphatase PhoE
MEISLIRHGKSKHIDNNRITCKEFGDWIKKYDSSGVFKENSYPSETLEIIASANLVLTSDLKRSIESVKLLNPNINAISEPVFRETELPNLFKKLWGLKLNPNIWAVILRCLWFCGYSWGCESLNNAKDRAKIASDLLAEYAQDHSSVVLVGHGFFNMLIAKGLQKMGWKCERKINSKHWNCTTYSLFS